MPGPFSIETQVAIDRAVAEERERCAKIADQVARNAEYRAAGHSDATAKQAALDKMEAAQLVASSIRGCSDKNGERA